MSLRKLDFFNDLSIMGEKALSIEASNTPLVLIESATPILSDRMKSTIISSTCEQQSASKCGGFKSSFSNFSVLPLSLKQVPQRGSAQLTNFFKKRMPSVNSGILKITLLLTEWAKWCIL